MARERVLGVSLAAIVAAAGIVAGAQAPTWWTASPGDRIERILTERIEREGGVGLALGVVEGGRARFAAGGALAKGGTPVDERTVFEIGSVSKVFTATLLAEMVVRGEVTLDTPVQRLLPAHVTVPSRNGREITLQDLATATSGLPRLPANMKPADPRNPYADYGVDQLYAFLSGHALTRDPGERYEYSNLGTGLLGHALALRVGRSYEALVVERILEPLGMRDTRITLTPDLRGRLARGHALDLEPASGWDADVLAGATAWRSTAADMARFVDAAARPPATPLGKALTLAMAPLGETGRPGLRIGLGWHVLEQDGRRLVWHNGQTGGYHAFVGIDSAGGGGLVLLGNAATSIDDIGFHLLDPAAPLQHPAPPRPTVTVDLAVLEEYVGRYELAPGFAIDIRRDGEALFVQATGQPEFRAFAASPARFFLRVVEAEVEFVRDDTGAVTGLVLHQGGRQTPGTRVRK